MHQPVLGIKMVEYGAKSESGEKIRRKRGRGREEETPYPQPLAVFLPTSLCAVHKIWTAGTGH